jgi:hypothetical protein
MAGLLPGSVAFAAPITPHYGTFGTLTGATFGGTGISNTAVAITNISNVGDSITLGLTATPEYPNPPIGFPLPNDGHGTFAATPGDGLKPGYATWNFDFYVNLSQSSGHLYNFDLIIMDNTTGLSNTVDFAPLGSAGSFTYQDSENLKFTGYGGPIAFNFNNMHQYGFELQAYDQMTGLLGISAIDVNVGSPSPIPDSGTTVAMLGLGLIGMFGFGLRKRFAKI